MSSNTLDQSSTNSENDPTTSTIFPIMDLPIDIRIVIYRYTVPNIFRDDWRVDTKALRDDGRLCCPALLRTNKKIHNEVIDEFYGREYYGLWINPSGWHFAGNNGMPIKNPLPPAIRWVQKLDLTIYLGKYSDNFNYKALLGDYFRNGSRSKLRKLRLRLLMSIEFFELYRDRPTSLRRGMEEELYPLKEGRGLQEVIVHSINHEHAITVYGHEKSFEKSMGDMLAVMRRFLDEVAIVMMEPDLTVPGRKDSGCAF